MSNVNTTTGIRFGTIAMQNLDQDLANELWSSPNAKDLSYDEAYDEAKAEVEKEFEWGMEEAEIAASEAGGLTDHEREDFIDKYLDTKFGTNDLEDFVDRRMASFNDFYESDEPRIEGKYEGVSYQIFWLGGAPNLWVFESPVTARVSLCSPCVPNAGDLDSPDVDGVIAYDVPYSWRAA